MMKDRHHENHDSEGAWIDYTESDLGFKLNHMNNNDNVWRTVTYQEY